MQTACDHLGRMNVPIIWGPGRHGISHNIFTYHRDPDDQMIELKTEMDEMPGPRSGSSRSCPAQGPPIVAEGVGIGNWPC